MSLSLFHTFGILLGMYWGWRVVRRPIMWVVRVSGISPVRPEVYPRRRVGPGAMLVAGTPSDASRSGPGERWTKIDDYLTGAQPATDASSSS